MQGIKVSIIVPVYNVSDKLHKCLSSLCSQTLADIEMILVNDGSTDDSGKICDEYAEKDSRIKTIHIENSGPAKARNKGIELAQGEYIGFVDSDDYVDPRMFEKLYLAGKNQDADIVMCSYNIVTAGRVERQDLTYQPFYRGNNYIKSTLLHYYYTGEIQGLYSLCIKIYKKILIQDNSLKMDEQLHRGEDAWFNFDALKVANSFVFIPDALYYYTQNAGSIMHTVQNDQYERWVDNRKRLLKENRELNFELDYNEFYASFLYKVAIYCRELAQEKKMKRIKQILQDSFYLHSAKYTAKLPSHIKMLHRVARLSSSLGILCVIAWGKISK